MLARFKNFVTIAAVAALVAGAAPIGGAFLSLDMAHAKSDKSKGGGDKGGGSKSKSNGGSKSKGNAAKSGGGSAKKSAKASASGRATAPGQAKKAAVEPQTTLAATTEEDAAPGKQKKINSLLGALNAAHASPKAFENASPNSRVGRIRAYRDAALISEGLAAALAEAQTTLDGTEAPDVSVDELVAQKDGLAAERAQIEAEIAALTQALADQGGDDPDLIAALEGANGALQDNLDTDAALDTQITDTVARQAEYDALVAQVDAARGELSAQQLIAQDLIAAAANKPVTEEVLAELHRLLGIAAPVDYDALLAEEEPVEEEELTALQ